VLSIATAGCGCCWTPMPDVIVYVTMLHAIEDK